MKLVCHRLSEIWQYYFFKLIGLSPCSIDSLKIICGKRTVQNKNYKCCFSYIGIFYNFILIAVTAVYNTWYIFYFLPTRSDFAQLKKFIVPMAAFAFLGIILVELAYTIRGKLLINFIDRLRIVDQHLDTCADYNVGCDNTNDWIFFVNLVFASIITIMFQFLEKDLHLKIFICIPVFLTTWPLIHFTMFINMVKLRFEGINCALSKLGTSKSKLLRTRELVLNNIACIERAYVEICKACDDIVSFYGFPLLIVILIVSVRFVRLIYTVILNFISSIYYPVGNFSIVLLSQATIISIVLTTEVTNVIKQVCID